MFLEDELAARRNRASRISISMLVAAVAVTASSLMISGLISAAHAEDARTPFSVTAPADAVVTGRQEFLQLAASPIMASSAVAVTMPHTASHADQQIMRGLTVMLLALMATSGLAVWHRRFRGVLGNAR